MNLSFEQSICKSYKQIQSKIHSSMQGDIFRSKQAKLIHFLTKYFHTKSTNSIVYSDSDFNKCVEMESVHLVVFLLLCRDNQQQSFSSSNNITETTKRNKHTRQKHKKVKGKYMIQGIPGFLLEESLFKVTSLTVASSSLVCRGRGCIGAVL